MAIQLNNLKYISQKDRWMSPTPDSVTIDDKLFIVSDNDTLAQGIIQGINELLNSKRAVNVTELNAIIDELLTQGAQRLATASLALVMNNRKGALVMQLGKSRVLHVSTNNNEIAYDSRNHILDTYSSKARIQQISDIKGGDIILITLSDMVDTQALLQMSASGDFDNEQFQSSLITMLSKHRTEAPASYILQFKGTAGIVSNMTNRIKDVNWKWMLLYLLLAGIIGVVALLSLNGKISLPSFVKNEKPIELQPVDTISPTDTINLDTLFEPEAVRNPEITDNEKNTVRNEESSEVKPENEAPVEKKNEEPATSEPQPQPQPEPTEPTIEPTPQVTEPNP